MNMPMQKEKDVTDLDLQPTQEQKWLQIIFQQQVLIEKLRDACQELLCPPDPVGWHNDPDWALHDKHIKNGATKKALAIMTRMRYRYGFE